MNKRPVDQNSLSEDWVGNNIAIQRPACAKAHLVSGLIHHGESALEKRGEMIGGNDLSIAAHAKSAGFTLVINNEREFKRVPGLKLQNWTRPHS